MHYKSNRRAFMMAVLVVLLCLVCLVGATLALFTNDLEDGTIGVIATSGNVKVDIVDDSEEQNSLVDQVLHFYSSAENHEVFFEPGVGFFTQGFKIKNDGDIPINFRLAISEDSRINMDEFSRAFDVFILKNTLDVSSAIRITDFKGRVEVNQTSTDTFYLYVKMKETAKNEFQNKEYIGIGVTVYAVQGNVDTGEVSTYE